MSEAARAVPSARPPGVGVFVSVLVFQIFTRMSKQRLCSYLRILVCWDAGISSIGYGRIGTVMLMEGPVSKAYPPNRQRIKQLANDKFCIT